LRFEHTLEIDAPPRRVWSVLSDGERWPDWTPTVTKVERLSGDGLSVGSKVRIHQPKLPVAVYTITALEPGKSFTWTTGNWFARGVAHHVVEPKGTGSRVTLSVDFSGLIGGLAARMYAKLTREYLALEAEGLKKRSEAEP
jgi:carbon monoxide dehydrogenase subunit G